MPSSPDSSSDSSTSSPHHPYTKMEGCHPASQEAESSLPGVVSVLYFYNKILTI